MLANLNAKTASPFRIQVTDSRRLFLAKVGIGLGWSYLAIKLTFSPLVSRSCNRSPSPPKKPKKRTLAKVGGEALMVAPWPLCAMAQVIFQGLDSVSTKPTIELSRSHLQSRGRAIFHPATSPCPRKYSQAHRGQGSQQHQGR